MAIKRNYYKYTNIINKISQLTRSAGEAMNQFSVNSPNWDEVEQAYVVDQARLMGDYIAIVPTSQGSLLVSITQQGLRLRMGDRIDYDYQMIKQEVMPKPLSIESSNQQSIIKADNQRLVIEHEPLSLTWQTDNKTVIRTATDGHFVRQYRIPPLAKLAEGWLLSFELGANEAVYGLGEKWSDLNKRGQLVRSYNCDALGVNAEISYKNCPFAWSAKGWGIFVHTPAPVTHSVGYAPWSNRSYGLLVEDSAFDVFIFNQPTPAKMLAHYTQLTGRAPIPPQWSLGVILSKAYYKDVDELLNTAKQVRDHKMPCDVITLDGRAWQDTDTRFAFEWDAKRYHDPKAVIDQLKAKHFKVCVWEYPLISVENPLYHKLAEQGWLIKDKRTGEAYQYEWDMSAFGEVLTPLPKSGILDFTHPEAYAFWRDSHKALFDMGVDMIKADFGEQIEDDNMIASNGETGHALHNVYSLLYNRCVYEAASKYSKTGAFLFSRSAWTGSQCLPAQWGGDPQADWGGLTGSVRGALSWGLTGAPYYATDVGGFYKDTRDGELYVRWLQVAVFSAHMRLHGIGQREPWSYGDVYQAAAEQTLALRYQLLPYLTKTIEQASQTGLPVQRAMVLAFPDEPQSWSFDTQFMFGDEILVAPSLAAGGEVDVYLPQGSWIKLDALRNKETRVVYHGGSVYPLQLELDEMAVFVREDCVIEWGDCVEHTEALTNHFEG